MTCWVPFRCVSSAAEEAQAQASTAQSALHALARDRKHALHSVDTLRAEVDAVSSELTMLQRQRDALSTEIADMQGQLHNAETAVADMHAANDDLLAAQRSHAALAQDVERLRKERDSAQSEATRAQRRATELEKQLAVLQTRVDAVETVRLRRVHDCEGRGSCNLELVAASVNARCFFSNPWSWQCKAIMAC